MLSHATQEPKTKADTKVGIYLALKSTRSKPPPGPTQPDPSPTRPDPRPTRPDPCPTCPDLCLTQARLRPEPCLPKTAQDNVGTAVS